MSFFQNKKRKGTFSENGPSPKQTRPQPAAPAPNNPQYILISQIIQQQMDQHIKISNGQIVKLREMIKDLKKEIEHLKADLSKSKRKLTQSASNCKKWDTTPSYIN